jgi:small subunit ribosomal protein S9
MEGMKMADVKKKPTPIIGVGKRKKSKARAVLKKGSGKLTINNRNVDALGKYAKLRIEETLTLAKNIVKDFDISVTVKGGGVWGQTDAVRTAIADALVKVDKKLREKYLAYDRFLLISDHRQTEPHKPSRSSQGPRRKKQQSKR